LKVLLIALPQYWGGRRSVALSFPLGLGYVAKALSKSGHDVEVLDIVAHEYTDEEVVGKIKQLDHDAVGISAFSTQYSYTKWLAAELKKCNGKKIVVGGALATHSPEIVLRNTEADICVIGEGEITFNEILANLDKLEAVKGICFKQGGEIIKNPPREYVQDLDSIEFPAWKLFPTDIYLESGGLPRYPNMRCIDAVSSRGCPFNCAFCSKTLAGVRFRSVDNIVAEIREFTGKYPQVNGISFWDELFVLNKGRVYELCDAIEPLNMKWSCTSRVDLVDFELLKRMKKAGCVVVTYGIESGSQSILDRMNKKVTVEQAQNAVRDTIKAGILPSLDMMYGYPGETRETLKETINFFKGLPYLRIGTMFETNFNPTMALPGSRLYDQAVKGGLIENEEEYLENLSPWIFYGSGKMLPGMNLTEFSEEEFHRLKRKTESEIFWGNIRRHPFRFAIDYLSYLFSLIVAGLTKVVPYLRRYGFKRTMQNFVRVRLFQLRGL